MRVCVCTCDHMCVCVSGGVFHHPLKPVHVSVHVHVHVSVGVCVCVCVLMRVCVCAGGSLITLSHEREGDHVCAPVTCLVLV